jgi:hypothetical protein
MKTTYRLNRGDYAIGESEKLYADMAKKGWRLKKRGRNFSRFEKAEPADTAYRIELASPAFLDDAELPQEQLDLYADCGWEYVTGYGLTHVFSASEGSGAPEIYTDPRQQAQTLRALRRSYLESAVSIVLLAGFMALIALCMGGSLPGVLYDWGVDVALSMFRKGALVVFYFSLLALCLFAILYGGARTHALYRRLKRGEAINHSPANKITADKPIKAVLAVICVVFALLSIYQLMASRKYDMPEVPDGPYITLSDLGFEGERTSSPLSSGVTSSVEVSPSLLATVYTTHEYKEDTVYMFQEIYVLKNAAQADRLTELLMSESIYAHTKDDFFAIDPEGCDSAWRCGNDVILIIGNTVYMITVGDIDDCAVSPAAAVANSFLK